MTLLEQAIKSSQVNTGRVPKITLEEINLAIAWARGDVTIIQCQRVMKCSRGNVYPRFALFLREAIQKGILSSTPSTP